MAICARIRGSPAPRTSWRGVLLWGCARSMQKSATAPAMKTVASSTAPWQARTACIAFLIMIVFEINQSAAGQSTECRVPGPGARRWCEALSQAWHFVPESPGSGSAHVGRADLRYGSWQFVLGGGHGSGGGGGGAT